MNWKDVESKLERIVKKEFANSLYAKLMSDPIIKASVGALEEIIEEYADLDKAKNLKLSEIQKSFDDLRRKVESYENSFISDVLLIGLSVFEVSRKRNFAEYLMDSQKIYELGYLTLAMRDKDFIRKFEERFSKYYIHLTGIKYGILPKYL